MTTLRFRFSGGAMAAQAVEDNLRHRREGRLGIPVGDCIDNSFVGGDGDLVLP